MNWKNRTYCHQIPQTEPGTKVNLYGFVDTIRDHGGLLFIHIRDVSGVVQMVFDPEKDTGVYQQAEALRSEWVIEVEGTLQKRTLENINPNIPTGAFEIVVDHLNVLSQAKTPPFVITEKELAADDSVTKTVDEDLRLKHRYLDLRRPSMQDKLIKRSKIIKKIRDYLEQFNFHDVETPMLTKSTPEGARDYLVPSRVHGGKFYALPQSPQLFKQLLMVSGLERYFQIVKCFRDEDLRPNRQPEFTQMDLEASYIDEEFIYELIEGLIKELFALENVTLPETFPRMSHQDAMDLYGSENPDLRFEMPLVNVTDLLTDCGYKIFNTIANQNGLIKGLVLPQQAEHLSKNMLQNDLAGKVIPSLGAKGMTWMKCVDGAFESNIVQFFSEAELNSLKERMGANDGDVMIFIADTNHSLVNDVLGQFRVYIAERLNLIDTSKVCPVWITNFPLFEQKDGRLHSVHHPFTMPAQELPDPQDKDALLRLTSRAYDLVINGQEVGGGSLRIYDSSLQQKIFDALGLSEAEIQEKFGFFVDALTYGTPPHGGIALGIDRLVGMILNTQSIREVIAFPKNRMAYCPLTQAPSSVDQAQLDDLSLKLNLNA